MKWLEIKVGYEKNDKILAIDLISAIFYDLGAQGVLIEDSAMVIEGNIRCKNLKSSEWEAVVGYLTMDKRIEQKFKLLKKRLESLESAQSERRLPENAGRLI